MKIDVLDQGFVRLVDHMGSDLSIVRAARVSYNADWRAGENEGSDERLIRYLMLNRHTTPFEAVVLTFEIKCPMFVARQWHRHRTWSYNEISARYTELDLGYYVPEPGAIGRQSKHNKQARVIEEGDASVEAYQAVEMIRSHCAISFDWYQELVAMGIPRELARSVLPMATYTRFFGTVNLHNLFHFISLRSHPHAQHEIQQYSNAILDLAERVAPVAVSAFKDARSRWQDA